MRRNKTNIFGIIITVIVLIVLVVITNTYTNSATVVQSPISKIIMPFQNGITYLKNKLSNNKEFFSNMDMLIKENEELKEKNNELEQNLRELEMIKNENRTLKEYMDLVDKYKEYSTVPAEIINQDISNYSKVFVINRGTKDGIEVDMPVLSEKGLVGYVFSVSDTTAKVKTIIDPSCLVSSKLSKSRDSVICKGALELKDELKLVYSPIDVTISIGDIVETSGMGGIYPKGIHIGIVRDIMITNNKIDSYAIITPAVDFDRLETVIVMKEW
jgi:rod shape-determining protein MreC